MKSLRLVVGGCLVLIAKVYILISYVNSPHRTGRTHVLAPSLKSSPESLDALTQPCREGGPRNQRVRGRPVLGAGLGRGFNTPSEPFCIFGYYNISRSYGVILIGYDQLPTQLLPACQVQAERDGELTVELTLVGSLDPLAAIYIEFLTFHLHRTI